MMVIVVSLNNIIRVRSTPDVSEKYNEITSVIGALYKNYLNLITTFLQCFQPHFMVLIRGWSLLSKQTEPMKKC